MRTLNFLLFYASVILLSSCSTYHSSNISSSKDLFQVQSGSGRMLNNVVEQSLQIKSTSAIENHILTPEVKFNTGVSGLESIQFEIIELSQAAKSESGKRKIVKQYIKEHKDEIRNALMIASASKELPQLSESQKADGAPFLERKWAALLAFFIPPLGAGLYFGKDKRTWISLGLFLLFWLPGAIYAMIMILRD